MLKRSNVAIHKKMHIAVNLEIFAHGFTSFPKRFSQLLLVQFFFIKHSAVFYNLSIFSRILSLNVFIARNEVFVLHLKFLPI